MIQVGGLWMPTSGLITLCAHMNATGTFFTARRMTGSAGYTPSGSKSFRVWATRGQSSGASSVIWTFLYTDNDCGAGNGTAATNPIYPGGIGAAGNYPFLADMKMVGSGSQQAVGEHAWGPDGFKVPNGKFLTVLPGTAVEAFAIFYGYEEA